jgi:hypothetical protein
MSDRTYDAEEVQDRVLDEYDAESGVRVVRVSRNGLEERSEWIKVYGTRSDTYASLDGNAPTEVSRRVIINEMPANVAYEVLVGLAEAHGCEVVPK